jgi:hypothetical protein
LALKILSGDGDVSIVGKLWTILFWRIGLFRLEVPEYSKNNEMEREEMFMAKVEDILAGAALTAHEALTKAGIFNGPPEEIKRKEGG